MREFLTKFTMNKFRFPSFLQSSSKSLNDKSLTVKALNNLFQSISTNKSYFEPALSLNVRYLSFCKRFIIFFSQKYILLNLK